MNSGPKNRLAGLIYQFDRFELDMSRFELREDGAVQPLEPQVLTLLGYLVEHRDRLVPKNEIFETLWDGRVVTDSALTSRIKSARRVLGDSGKAQHFIRTVYGKGFRFVADVSSERSQQPSIISTWRVQSPHFLHVYARGRG